MNNPSDAQVSGIEAYAAFYEAMTLDSLDTLARVVTDDVWFEDPFNAVRGIDGMRTVMAHMFEVTTKPRFTVTHKAWAGDRWFLRWIFEAGIPVIGAWSITGMSEVQQAEDGRISSHVDHWDSGTAFDARIPVLGAVLRFIRRRSGTFPR